MIDKDEREFNRLHKDGEVNVQFNFDLIINLGAVGMGASLVSQQSLALYARRHAIVRLPWPKRFVRELVVVARRQRETPEHIQRFVANILF